MKVLSNQTLARTALFSSTLAIGLNPSASFAAGITGEVEEIIVSASGIDNSLDGYAEAASVGTVLPDQIEHRPMLRPAELLETIPGMIVTQHSGGGKANQYFLRGFNLDHGTDFANYIEGMPVNMVTHGHGQGYTDLNFLIPELVSRMVYKKGPYYAEEGDFSSAGAAHIDYATALDSNSLQMSFGENNFRRLLLLGDTQSQEQSDRGNLVYAFEFMKSDGPWKVAEDFNKKNGVLKYSLGNDDGGSSITGIYYDVHWTATDQVPQRLVESGEVDRFGSLDETTGGETHRYSVSAKNWGSLNDSTQYQALIYATDYELTLIGNSSYYSRNDVEDPARRGDQFTQFDKRNTYGGHIKLDHWLNDVHQLHGGWSVRYDDIANVGLAGSENAGIYELRTQASVEELAHGVYGSVHSQWTDWFASIVGVRYDNYTAKVDDKLSAAEEKEDTAELVSPKLSLRVGPFAETEFFANYGEGFHSNDARGAVDETSDVPFLAESKGYEIGLRTAIIPDLQLSLVAFHLDLDSELVFIGDEGTTEAVGASIREGIELGVYYQPTDWFIVDVDYANSTTRFKDEQFDGAVALGRYVPASVDEVFSMGASVDFDSGFYAGLRLRYFGPRKLTESGDIKSDATGLVNANIGYRWQQGALAGWNIGVEVLNLLNEEDDDITYYYASRTLDERIAATAPVEDRHSHPVESRTVRVTITKDF